LIGEQGDMETQKCKQSESFLEEVTYKMKDEWGGYGIVQTRELCRVLQIEMAQAKGQR
jgi:hypothetical protein